MATPLFFNSQVADNVAASASDIADGGAAVDTKVVENGAAMIGEQIRGTQTRGTAKNVKICQNSAFQGPVGTTRILVTKGCQNDVKICQNTAFHGPVGTV